MPLGYCLRIIFCILDKDKKSKIMKQIVIRVDKPTAIAFGKFSPETKSQFDATVALTLKKMINNAISENHKRFLDELSNEAERNRLTEDIFNDLLKSGD